MEKQGKLIVFEGGKGVGKSTISELLYRHLSIKSIPCRLLAFPGRENRTLGKHIYLLHHDPNKFSVNDIHPLSLQILHIAAHIDAIENIILPELFSGKNIILDRFWWSTLVYGKINKVNKNALDAIIKAEKICWDGIIPSHIFLVTRNKSINNEENTYLWESVSKEYQDLANSERKIYPVHTLDNNGLIEETLSRVIKIVNDDVFT